MSTNVNHPLWMKINILTGAIQSKFSVQVKSFTNVFFNCFFFLYIYSFFFHEYCWTAVISLSVFLVFWVASQSFCQNNNCFVCFHHCCVKWSFSCCLLNIPCSHCFMLWWEIIVIMGNNCYNGSQDIINAFLKSTAANVSV